MQIVPLALMATGESGRVCDVDGTPDVVVRLEEMGLNVGAKLTMIKTGSPCIVAVNDQRFSLRLDDSATIMVEVIR